MIPWQIPAIGAALCLAVLTAIALAPSAKAFRMGWFAIATFVLVLYAGTKPPQPTHLWRFEFENGVQDFGSYCTNDFAHACWTYNPSYANHTFRWAYRDLTITNEVGVCIDEWHYLPDALVSDGMTTATVFDATNMEYACYALYIPPPHVVTNGVYHMEGVSRSMATTNSPAPDYVTWGTRVEVVLWDGSITVLTPTNRPPEPILLNSNQGE